MPSHPDRVRKNYDDTARPNTSKRAPERLEPVRRRPDPKPVKKGSRRFAQRPDQHDGGVRTRFSAGTANGINDGSARILSEPIATRRQDAINIVDVRVEKVIHLASATYLTPSTIVPPRLARVGLKFDW